MEVRSRGGRRGEREISPDRAKVCMQPRAIAKPLIKKVQVVYYLSRNGQLEHPHYMEVTHLTNQNFRLRDFMDRLSALRGKGIPSLYSWSCKRNYKSGYVWNDLTENDVIYPSDGDEYVLKGSEIVEGCSERFRQLDVSSNNRQIIQESNNLHAKRKQVLLDPIQKPRQMEETKCYHHEFEEEEQESQEEYEDEEKTSYTSSTTPHSRCSRGVSTDELEDQPNKNNIQHATTESAAPSILSDKAHPKVNNTSKRFEDGGPIATDPASTGRNSVLLQLISCGNLSMAKAKNAAPSLNQPAALKVSSSTNNGTNAAGKRSESNNLHKGVLYKSAVKVAEEDMIMYMSENPRFGNLQAEDKEYFSGSIVESMSENRVMDEPATLKRSNSYNEERYTKAGMEEIVKEEIRDKGAKGKCIPLKKSSSSTKQTKSSRFFFPNKIE